MDRHDEIALLLRKRFHIVRDGVQVDNFSSITTHEVKSSRPGAHVKAVIEVLREKYRVEVRAAPELEANEEE